MMFNPIEVFGVGEPDLEQGSERGEESDVEVHADEIDEVLRGLPVNFPKEEGDIDEDEGVEQ